MTVCLTVIILFQAGVIYQNYGRLWLSRAVRTYNLPSMERNALFLYGGKGAQFLEFISNSIDFDQPVVSPSGYDIFSEQSLLQFFLFPRAIIGCPCSSFLQGEAATEACTDCLLDPDRSVISIGAFPPTNLLEREKQFISFTDSTWYHGLFVPRTVLRNDSNSFIHMEVPLLRALFIDLGLLGLLVFLGAFMAFVIDEYLAWSDLLTLSIPLGVGSTTFILFVIARLGVRITLASYLLVVLTILTGCLAAQIARHKKLFPTIPKINKSNGQLSASQLPVVVVLTAGVVIMGIAALVISAICGHSSFDGIANWVLKGYAIAETGSVTAGSLWGGHGLSYPQNIHLMVALFRLADGDVVPGSKLAFTLFFFALLLGCYVFWRKFGVSREFALLGVLIIFSTPYIFEHATLSWANLTFSVYLVLGLFYLIDALKLQRSNQFWISGMLIGFAVWTRPEGVGYAIALGVTLVLIVLILRVQKRAIVFWLIPSSMVVLIWMTFSYQWMASDEIGSVMASFLPAFARGDLRPEIIGNLVSFAATRFTSVETWGLIIISSSVLLVGGVIRMRRRISLQIILTLIGVILFFLIPLFMFYAAGFNMEDPTVFLSVSFDRAQFHGVILLLVGAMLIFGGDKDEDKSYM
jgi:hypothetical protein